MKPYRHFLVDDLVQGYGLDDKMSLMRYEPASKEEMIVYHDSYYIDFISQPMENLKTEKANVINEVYLDTDCPNFTGLFDYCQLIAGGSLAAARSLNNGLCDVAINWGGGLHHAKWNRAYGFCYVNDPVLAIVELLKHNGRVLYLDIDCHHGDGVEAAFYSTNRVMTLSFHLYEKNFFPGTGNMNDIGVGAGLHHSSNVPLKMGITDDDYEQIFKPIVSNVLQKYQPNVIVMQCGTDSLAGDRLGRLNLTLKGHSNCVKYVISKNIPLILLGGGGYRPANAARCWTLETAIALEEELPISIPEIESYEYFAPEFRLEISPVSIENKNTSNYISDILRKHCQKCQNETKREPQPSQPTITHHQHTNNGTTTVNYRNPKLRYRSTRFAQPMEKNILSPVDYWPES
ncbi:histone deacetylase family protein [Trichinella nativa]|uniref:Histone deacetylase n=1 Tax=Trichinella nativa TaxID=6335 RepID=A0A1Y3F1L2_9BILA|nr:histone deacetylase family protein [Trichinella nativa]